MSGTRTKNVNPSYTYDDDNTSSVISYSTAGSEYPPNVANVKIGTVDAEKPNLFLIGSILLMALAMHMVSKVSDGMLSDQVTYAAIADKTSTIRGTIVKNIICYMLQGFAFGSVLGVSVDYFTDTVKSTPITVGTKRPGKEVILALSVLFSGLIVAMLHKPMTNLFTQYTAERTTSKDLMSLGFVLGCSLPIAIKIYINSMFERRVRIAALAYVLLVMVISTYIARQGRYRYIESD
jgi:hypothetical protein